MAKVPAAKRKAPTKPAPKSPPKATRSKPNTNPVGGLDDPEDTMRIRKITNGYIVHESWVEGSGANRKYRERETFTKVKPQVIVAK